MKIRHQQRRSLVYHHVVLLKARGRAHFFVSNCFSNFGLINFDDSYYSVSINIRMFKLPNI